ncbi:AAA family ATPase [Kitasatospora sp. NPDC086791]|uniref:AAA family ATPase n=1 Tax=Kitasatospora sp. NPDC086791 TaxID=3155178 RepID=UPI003417D262
MTTTVTIPDRFRTEVLQHLILSYINLPEEPLIMGIFGYPGEGKTFQLRTVLAQSAVEVYSVNAADLESDRAGAPGKLILERYVTAAHRIGAGRPCALLIDDVDTTIGEWSQNTGTVNHQQVLAQLMHLADHPTFIEKIGSVRRVPVFVTGNDPAKLYPPLRRPGRMGFLYWQPTDAEREAVLTSVFEGLLTAPEVARLMKSYAHRPVSFFAQVRGAVIRDVCATLVGSSAANLAAVVDAPEKYASFVSATMNSLGPDIAARTEAQARKLDCGFDSADRAYLTGP